MEINIQNGAWIEASLKRVLLAWYIDFLFFMVLWVPLGYLVGIQGIPFWLPYIAFIVIRPLVAKYIGSIGNHALSISGHNNAVDEHILNRESWLTMLIGVLLILDGTKMIVRWTEVLVSQPWFGVFLQDNLQVSIQVAVGIASIISGYWVLRLDVKGWIAGLILSTLYSLSIIFSWHLWDPVVEQMVLKHRAFQGFEIGGGEIEFMQTVIPEGLLFFSLSLGVIILFNRDRFSRSL